MTKLRPNQLARGRKAHFPQPLPKAGEIRFLGVSHRDWIWGLLIMAVTLMVYQPAWNGKPVWDDEGHITKPELRSTAGLLKIWTQPGITQQYYPLLHSTFWLSYYFWGERPLGYHLLNILLHSLSAFFLLIILKRLEVPGASLAAAVFALHPVMVESVAWITELKNTLSGAFYLSSALSYLGYHNQGKRKWYVLSLVLFILGLISKSVTATLPAALLVVFWWKRGLIDWRRDLIPLLPFFTAGIFSGLFTIWVERRFIGAQGGEFSFSMVERVLIAGRVIWFYLGKLLWPSNLMLIYPRWKVSGINCWQYLFPVLALGLFSILWLLRKRWRAPLSAFLYFIGTLLPVLGFFNVYPFRYSFVADHFQYLAAIGPIALVTAGIWKIKDSIKSGGRFLTAVIAGLIILALGLLSHNQSGMYEDAETLYRINIQKNPDCWMAYNNLGVILANRGLTEQATANFRKALEIKSDYAEPHNNLGLLLSKQGKIGEAVGEYRQAIGFKPDYCNAYNNLGVAYQGLGRYDEAINEFREAIRLNPDYDRALENLAICLDLQGKRREARQYWIKALLLEKRTEWIGIIKNRLEAPD